jgi:hypothetical protein
MGQLWKCVNRQQHRLQKQPAYKAAKLSDDHDAENGFSLGGPNQGGSGERIHLARPLRRFDLVSAVKRFKSTA